MQDEFIRNIGRDKDPRALCEMSGDDEDANRLVGRDPRKVTTEEYRAAGHEPMPVLKVIRAKCLDCCAGSQSEVRKCIATGCPNWPYRMGANPFRAPSSISDEKKQEIAERLRSGLERKRAGSA
jgi:hypothetical protein